MAYRETSFPYVKIGIDLQVVGEYFHQEVVVVGEVSLVVVLNRVKGTTQQKQPMLL